MFSLIKKDLLIQKSSFLYGIMAAFIAIISFQNLKETMVLAVTFILTYVFMQYACYCDDNNNAHLLLNSLPVSRKHVVLSRYISLFVFFLISLGYYTVLTGIIKIFAIPLECGSLSLEGNVRALTMVLFVNSIVLPVFYRFGYSKSRIVNLILFVGIFSAFGALESTGGGFAGFFKGKMLSSYFSLILAVFVYALSFVVSVKVYSNKEF